MGGLFITGVGTGVGKTLVMTILCQQMRAVGRNVVALKPIVSGFDPDDPNSDPALILRSLGVEPTPEAIATVSPWRFAAPVAPHLAARREGRSVTMKEVVAFYEERTIDVVSDSDEPDLDWLVEGAGGVMSPLCDDGTCLDLIAWLGEPAVLVTGTYLGAISHTLTALEVLRDREIRVRGIVVSESAESAGLEETIEILREFEDNDTPIYPLPRLAGRPGEPWYGAPSLLDLCEDDDDE